MPVPAPGLRNNVSFITLGVSDLDRSRRFYRDMGLEEHPRSNDDVAFFEMNGQILALFPRSALAGDSGREAGDPARGITTTLAQNVHAEADITSVLDRAVRSGGTLLKAASAPPWGGVRGYFSDPDGFIWEIAWNPATTIDEFGRIAIGADRDPGA